MAKVSFLVSPAATGAAASVCSQPSVKRGCVNRRDPGAASAFMQEATKNLREIEDQVNVRHFGVGTIFEHIFKATCRFFLPLILNCLPDILRTLVFNILPQRE